MKTLRPSITRPFLFWTLGVALFDPNLINPPVLLLSFGFPLQPIGSFLIFLEIIFPLIYLLIFFYFLFRTFFFSLEYDRNSAILRRGLKKHNLYRDHISSVDNIGPIATKIIGITNISIRVPGQEGDFSYFVPGLTEKESSDFAYWVAKKNGRRL